ncbi:MAG: YbhB/YbcL family Raf kinase inhibitor-like protein [Anaerolineales bacterium]|nr:YbhB/YbcL family Raf kinase inhibitor-like protein [Anaerolineales bacterium]
MNTSGSTRPLTLILKRYVLPALGLFLLLGCSALPTPTPSAEVSSLTSVSLTSPTFADGEAIPPKYTCDGEDISPPLSWQGVPEEAASLVLIMDDPDAPGGTWVHWVLYNIPPALSSLPENAAAGAVAFGQGYNSWQRPGFGGPCPPSGTHRYFFTLYALDSQLSLPENATKEDVENALAGHILVQTQLMGTYTHR